MANPNPKIENLTRAGMGRPRKGLTKVTISLSPELLKRLAEIQAQHKLTRNYLVEQILRSWLGMQSDNDLESLINLSSLETVVKGEFNDGN